MLACLYYSCLCKLCEGEKKKNAFVLLPQIMPTDIILTEFSLLNTLQKSPEDHKNLKVFMQPPSIIAWSDIRFTATNGTNPCINQCKRQYVQHHLANAGYQKCKTLCFYLTSTKD